MNWTFENINDIFKKVLNGAQLIAMQKNKFWKTPEQGILIDAGAFITGIEYAADVSAILVGKPSPIYFQMGLERLGFDKKEKFLMLGDDLETDIMGAQNLDSKGILIYTGKTEYPLKKDSRINPDYEAKDLKAVISLLKKIE